MKILLISSKLFGYEKLIENELKKYGEIEFLDYRSLKNECRKIRNPFKRLINNILFKKIGKDLSYKQQVEKINEFFLKKEDYDCIIKIGPIFFEEKTLNILKLKSKIIISHYWDTIPKKLKDKIEIEKRTVNKISTFDPIDAQKYNLDYLPNFYNKSGYFNENIEQDVYTIMSNIESLELLEKIGKNLKENNITFDINLITKKKIKSKYINIGKEYISINKMLDNFSKSKVILEILRKENNGCTFRTMDCIGMHKKLITNNKNIINEDFYNPNNILIIDENNIEISKSFIDSPYEELSKEIYKKYNLKSWIRQLLGDLSINNYKYLYLIFL